MKKSGVEMIREERERQIQAEGWTYAHDDGHTEGQLLQAGIAYAHVARLRENGVPMTDRRIMLHPQWPWDLDWWKPATDPLRNLVKAGALIAAEIDRLQRLPD